MEYYPATKGNIWVSSTEVDELRACYTDWNKSERENELCIYFLILNWGESLFIMLCWFLPYSRMKQPSACLCPLPPDPASPRLILLDCHKAPGLS